MMLCILCKTQRRGPGVLWGSVPVQSHTDRHGSQPPLRNKQSDGFARISSCHTPLFSQVDVHACRCVHTHTVKHKQWNKGVCVCVCACVRVTCVGVFVCVWWRVRC